MDNAPFAQPRRQTQTGDQTPADPRRQTTPAAPPPSGRRKRARWHILSLAGLLVVCFLASLLIGESTEEFAKKGIPARIAETCGVVIRHIPLLGNLVVRGVLDKQMEQIVWDIRVPRLLLALLVGASLSAAGAVMQCFFQNPMASPYIVGVSSGAALGAAVAFAFDISFSPGRGTVAQFLADQPEAWLAFVGALGVTLVVYVLSRRGGKIHLPTLLLTGIALGTLTLSVAWFILFWRKPYDYEGVIFRLMGSFNGKGWTKVAMVFPYVLIGVGFISVFARDLNVLLLGEETAQHLGVNVERTKLLLLVASTVMAAACVAAVGVIGFVGLVVPHLMRLIVGPDHRALIPACLLGGGFLLILADDAARLVFNEMIPIGVITSIIGCPFFLYLLTQKEKRFF